MNTELLKSKLLEAAFNGSLTHADTSKWEHKHLKDTCNHQNGDRGKNYPSKNKLSHEGIPFISALNLSNNTVIDDDKLLKMSDEQFNKLGNGKLNKGDFVLCIRGSVGKHGIYPFDKGAIASSLVILRPNEDKLNLMWLSYYFDSSLFRENLLDSQNGTAQPNLAAKELMQFLIPLPPLPEQERIVSALEEGFAAIDAIAEAKANLSNTAEMLRSKILQAAFDGSLTGADISRWDKFQLGEIFSMKAGKNISASQIHNEKSDKFPYPCYGGNGIRGYVDSYNTAGTFSIIGRQGALCGNVKHVEGKFYATEHAVVVSNIKDVDTQWAYHALTYLDLNQYATSTAQPGLSVKKIEQITIPLPPLAEQERIVAKIESLFTEIDKLSK